MADERDINALRYYVARLEDDLAIAEDAVEHLHRHSSKQAADIMTLGQEVGRLLENAKQDAKYLAAYHYWCQVNNCAPSSSDLINTRAALAEKEPK